MKCEQVKDRLISLVYGELPCGEQETINRHLAECELCSREASTLKKTHELLDAGATPEDELTTLTLSRVSQRAVEHVELSRRRWRTAALATAAAVVVLALLQLVSVSISFDQDRMEIAWGQPEAVSLPPQFNDQKSLAPTRSKPLENDPEARLEDLDRLVLLLFRLNQADSRGRGRDLVALTKRLDSLEKQNETWHRTVNYLIHNLRAQGDLAHQITPARLEGGFE